MSTSLKSLQKLGLSEKEARLYLVSLETGPATIAKLAQKSGVKRGTIYEFLGEMIDKGVFEISISGKRKLYCGVEPKKLKRMIDKQRKILDSLIPDLSLLASKGTERPKIKFYEGKDGLLSAYYEILNSPKGEEILGFSTFKGVYEIFSKIEINNYIKKRVAKKIKEKLIMPTDEHMHNHLADNKKELRETIMINRKNFPINNEINIYQDKVVIISLGEEKVAVVIESKQIAQTQRAIFNLLWKSLRKKKDTEINSA